MFKGLGDMAGLLKQAQKLQKEAARVQDELKERVVEGSAGGGMVRVQANGQQEVLSVKIEREVINPDDAEMLEDLVVAAINQSLQKARDLAKEEFMKVTGGLSLPGLFPGS